MSEPVCIAQPLALVVDDESVVRLFERSALEGAGFEVIEAESGEQAVELAISSKPELILLDVEMPGCGGFEACQRIRALPGFMDVGILMVTARTEQETIDRAFEVGATDFVSKPVDWQLLQHRARFVRRASRAFSDQRETIKQLLDSRIRLVHAQQIARLGHWECQTGTDAMDWSEELVSVLGIREDPNPSWTALLALVHPEDRPSLEKIRAAMDSGEQAVWQVEHRILTPDGTRIVKHNGEAAAISDSGERLVLGTIQDITERRSSERQIEALSQTDSVTGLPNRRNLYERLERLLADGRGSLFAVMSINIDRFRRVNDLLGNAGGDRVLRRFAERTYRALEEALSEDSLGPYVARVGSDEFAAVLRGPLSADWLGHQATALLDALARPFDVDGQQIELTASIGIAVYPGDGVEADGLLRSAGAARLEARTNGGHGFRFCSASLTEEAERRLTFETHLRGAIEHDELALHYQPKVEATSGAIRGLEALIRWQSPTLGFVSPAEFIPIAEDCNLIHRIGEWVLERACRDLRAWHDQGLPRVPVAVNVSSKQLTDGSLPEKLAGLLERYAIEPSDLQVEITESALLVTGLEVERTLQKITEMGIELALDDFGTGYSSLTHLYEFPIDVVKIDRSFVTEIDLGRGSAAIVRSVITMAHDLGMKVVAEGVETPGEADALREMGCDQLQGYLFARPMPKTELEDHVRAAANDASCDQGRDDAPENSE